MKLTLTTGIVVAAIAWVILYVVIGIPLWIAFVVAAAIILGGLIAGGSKTTTGRTA